MNFADRVKETTTSTSAAVIVLGGAVAKFRSFASSLAVGDTGIPVSMDDGNGNWENGEYTLTDATTLTRTAIYASSNGGAPTVFPAGLKEVFCTMASETLKSLSAGMPSIVYSASAPVNTDGKPNNTLYFQTTPTNGVISMFIKLGGAYQPVGSAVPSSGNGAVTPAPVPQKATITIAPSQLTTVSGSPAMGADFDGAPVLRLPNASNEIAFIADTAEVGQKYDVYMLWTLSAAPTSPSPAVANLAGTYTPWASGSSPSGTTRFFGIVPPQAPGVIERSQLPFSFTREDAGRIARVRYGRRADSIGGNIQIRGFELVPTPPIVEASITQGAALTPTSFNTPYATSKVISLLSLYTPIWSTANAVYVAAPVTIGGVEQSRLAKLNKNTYEVIQDVQIGTGTHDTVIGHRDPSVCVMDDGKVFAYPERHHTTWAGLSSPTEDISALAAVTAPVGLNTQCSYRRFFRNPFDGSMWMGVRGNGYLAGIYKWNGTTFDRKPGATFVAGDEGIAQGSYGMEIAFTDANTLYVTTEYRQGFDNTTLSGYPRLNIGMIKSVDGGSTFTNMRGKALALPLVNGRDDADIAFPNNNLDHNSAVGRIAIGADGQPMLIASWRHPEETRRSLWIAKYNTITDKWIRTRLLPHNGSIDAGTPHVAYHNGKVVVTAASTDDNETRGINNQLYIFTTTDSGASWKKYTITHPVGAYSGAYIDPAALRLDNKLRLLPDFEAQPNSVVWELPIPA